MDSLGNAHPVVPAELRAILESRHGLGKSKHFTNSAALGRRGILYFELPQGDVITLWDGARTPDPTLDRWDDVKATGAHFWEVA